MQLGMVGLGRMGANLVRRLMRGGHECVVYDVNADAVALLEHEGATGAASLEEFVRALSTPRAVSSMELLNFFSSSSSISRLMSALTSLT